MRLSYIIMTRNRRQTLLGTLERLYASTPVPRSRWEIVVADNASDDATPDAIAQHFPRVRLIRNTTNLGTAARNQAIALARGRFLVLLDDDSYPLDNAVCDSIDFLSAHPLSAAVVGRAILPNGQADASAMPGILLACATCIRADVLRQVGGFPADFVRQAEEYDLSFRIWDAGFCIDRFEDVCYRHEKVPGNRPPADICRLDLRNNLLLVQRHLPQPWRSVYRRDWLWRYALIARANDQPGAVDQALAGVRQLAAADRHRFQPVSAVALECIFEWNRQAQTVAAWAADHRIRRVVIADVGKNLYATWRACGLAGLSIRGITSDQPAFIGQSYRGIDVAGESNIDAAGADGVILSNTNPAVVEHRLAALRSRVHRPVLALWQPRRVHELRQCA